MGVGSISVRRCADQLFSFSSAGRREAHDAVRACISMPCPGMSLKETQGHGEIAADPEVNETSDNGNASH